MKGQLAEQCRMAWPMVFCCLNALLVFKVWLQKEAWELLGQPGIAIAELLRVSKVTRCCKVLGCM